MQPLAFWMPGPWEIVILGACCFGFLLMAAAVVLLALFLARRKPGGKTPDPGRPQ